MGFCEVHGTRMAPVCMGERITVGDPGLEDIDFVKDERMDLRILIFRQGRTKGLYL